MKSVGFVSMLFAMGCSEPVKATVGLEDGVITEYTNQLNIRLTLFSSCLHQLSDYRSVND